MSDEADTLLLVYQSGFADGKKAAQQQAEPICPECKAAVLYECVACSSNNYPPQQQAEFDCPRCGHVCSQRQWQGLTDEAIWQIATDCTIGGDLHADKFARAIEAAHNIKEGT